MQSSVTHLGGLGHGTSLIEATLFAIKMSEIERGVYDVRLDGILVGQFENGKRIYPPMRHWPGKERSGRAAAKAARLGAR